MKNPWATSAVFVAAALPLAAPAQTSVALPPTTVTATRFPDNSQSLPFGVSVVTAEEIERSGATTVNEALMRVLGVVGRQDFYGGGEYNIDLRGFGSASDVNQVVVVDGIRMSEGDLGGTRLAGIPIESVERIEVICGSGSVLYGEGATGGVIVITTKAAAGKSRPNGGSVYAGVGSYGLRDYRANANAGAGGFSLDAAAQKRDVDNHRKNFSSKTDAESLTAQWAGEWLRVGARYSQDKLHGGLPGALTLAQFEVDPSQSTHPDDHATIRQTRTSAFAQAQGGEWELAADVGTRNKKLRSTNSGFNYDYDITADNASLRARNSHDFGGMKNLLVAGFDATRWTRDVLGAFGVRSSQRSNAWYLKDDVTLASGTRIGLGWRAEHAKKEDAFNPGAVDQKQNAWELGASHPFGAITGYARIGRSFRFANADEFSFLALATPLRPQASRDTEAGVRWSHEAGKVEARLYRSDITDEIGFDPGAPPFGGNVNFDPTRRQGLELDATQRLSAALGLRLNANIREATFRSGPYAGKDVPLVPRRTVNLRADWMPAPQHRVSGGVQWISSQHPDLDNACSMPAYTNVDLRYAYQWKNAEFSAGVTNLLDRKYYSLAFACAGGKPTSVYPEPGRAFTTAVRVKF